jgi:hypothetical protein
MQLGSAGSLHVQPLAQVSTPHGVLKRANAHIGAVPPSGMTQLTPPPERQLMASPPSGPRHESAGKHPPAGWNTTPQFQEPPMQRHS